MYGSLQAISEEVLEAAHLDGANHWQMATRIKLPLVKKYIVFMAVLTFAAGLQLFVEPQLISASVYEGIATGWTLNQVGYDYAFVQGNFSQAAAVSLILLVVQPVRGLVAHRSDQLLRSDRGCHLMSTPAPPHKAHPVNAKGREVLFTRGALRGPGSCSRSSASSP